MIHQFLPAGLHLLRNFHSCCRKFTDGVETAGDPADPDIVAGEYIMFPDYVFRTANHSASKSQVPET